MKTVNQFLTDRVKEEYQPIITKFRNLIHSKFPFLTEEMRGGTEKYYGVPVYRNNKIIITVSPTQKGVTFSFTDGKLFEDKYNLLEGVGNKTLNLRISDSKEYSDEVFEYYILQAIALDHKKDLI
jgi:hypothetical protein|tara:strand:- start:276 stop:650 length:375 start_codon:yes stop_codon:yes gene_type:complete